MEVYHIPKNVTIPLLRIFELEHIREEGSFFTSYVSTYFSMPVHEIVSANFVNTFCLVVADNLLRMVVDRDSLSLVAGMQNGTLGQMMDVGYRHLNELVTEEPLMTLADTFGVGEDSLRCSIHQHLNNMYLKNKEEFDAAILTMYELLYTHFSNLPITSYRFTFTGRAQLAVIVSGVKNEIS